MSNEIVIDIDEDWNSVALSLATNGGYLVSKGIFCIITIYVPKFDPYTLLLEKKFINYKIKTSKLMFLYDDINKLIQEIKLHENDTEEQEKVDIEKEKAIFKYKEFKEYKKSKNIDGLDIFGWDEETE